MKKLLLPLLFLVASCSTVQPPPPPITAAAVGPVYGHDILGLGNPNIQAKTVIEAIEPGVALGFFSDDWDGNFGNPYPKLKEICNSVKRPSILRGQCFWSYQHKPAPLKRVRQCATKLQNLALACPSAKVIGSPSCEYDNSTTKRQLKDWAVAFKVRAPLVEMVLTPMNGPIISGYRIEQHGDTVVDAEAVSTDGQNIFDANANKLISDNPNAEYILGWGLRYNLAEVGTDLPPSKRTADPTVQYIRSIGALNKPRVLGNFKYPQLYKTHAEDKAGSMDPRANKPLLILKERASHVDILDSNLGLLGRFPYYDTYLDQGYRYYSGSPSGMGLYGYEIGELARKRTGLDAIKVRVNGRVYDIGSAAFRGNYYQK